MIRTITSEDLKNCTRLFVKVFSEWPYEESWSVTQAHHYLSRFWKFDPDHCLVALDKDDVIALESIDVFRHRRPRPHSSG